MPYHVLIRKQLQKERSGSQPANRSFQSPSSESQPRTQRSPILVGSKFSTGWFTRNGEKDELSVSDEDLDFMNEAEVPEEAVPTGDQAEFNDYFLDLMDKTIPNRYRDFTIPELKRVCPSQFRSVKGSFVGIF